MAETLGGEMVAGAPDPRPYASHPRSWRVWLPDGLRAGLHAETPGDPSGLVHAGENWAGPEFGVREHLHAVWELYVQLSGRSAWLVGDRVVRLAEGWAIAVPPGLRHRSLPGPSSAPMHFAYAAFDLDIVGRRLPELARGWPRRLLWTAAGQSLVAPLRLLTRELAEERPDGPAALKAALDLVCVETVRSLLRPGVPTARLPRHPAVAHAQRLLDERYASRWRVEDLAAACRMSPAHLTECFTAEVGQPPYAYLLQRRADRAAELLDNADRSVGEIAVEVGFGSAAQLGRAFRRRYRTSPREWRRRGREPCSGTSPREEPT